MVAGYRGVILAAAAGLILTSIMLASIDENTSSILIFTTILSSAIVILYWKLFNSDEKSGNLDSASPIKTKKSSGKTSFDSVKSLKSEVPDPLDEDIDIPLM
ncbi:MAG: hypothetical protein ISR22_05005 [Candidatus Poseidoniaceae archaeon]|nr:hypothetical protein [Euryarchaeota archaeon]MBL6891388.1 hypothetical protein [Candidatus Poseidoniaceae archaeon]RAH06652.1 MAG: hypothetical protein CBC92_003495 [Euryarchaeota archaeon TMED132]|tara:strand:- start:27038 stop:27343 length:306 start_codon:yes stop_codon:yes gene_type:complete